MKTESLANGGLAGKVVDATGKALSGVTIGLSERTTLSDANGAFAFVDLVPRGYTVSAQRSGYESQSRSVDVLSGRTTDGVNFSLAEKGLIFSITTNQITSNGAVLSFYTRDLCRSHVEYGLNNSYGNITPELGSGTLFHSFTLTNLTPQTTYHFRAVAVDTQGRTLTSADKTFTTLYTRRGEPPKNLAIKKSATSDAIELTWSSDTGTDLAGYNIYRSGYQNGGFQLLARQTQTQATGYIDVTLNPGEKAFYYVTRVSGTGEESSPSNTVDMVLPGILKTNVIWSPEQGVIALKGDLFVRADRSLTILPGTVVQVAPVSEGDLDFPPDGKIEITVLGALMIDATASKPVVMTSGSTNPLPGDWLGIRFDPAANLDISAVRGLHLSFAKTGLTGTLGLPHITDSKFLNCTGAAVDCRAARRSIEIKNNTIENCEYGVYLASNTNNRIYVAKNTIHNCSYGVFSQDNGDSQIVENRITLWRLGGIDVRNQSASAVSRNVVAPGTGGTGIICRGRDEIRRNTVQAPVCLDIRDAAEVRFYSNLLLADGSRGGIGMFFNGNGSFSLASHTIQANDIWSQSDQAYMHRDKSGNPIAPALTSWTDEPQLTGGNPLAASTDTSFNYQPLKTSPLKGRGYGGEDIGAYDVPL